MEASRELCLSIDVDRHDATIRDGCRAEEYLSKGGVEDEETQRESLQVETDAELAEDAVCAWNLEDMDFDALMKAFSDLRMRLAA